MKFKFSCKKGNKFLIKLVLDNGDEKWAETEQKVSTYAKNNFTDGEECDFEYNVKNDQYFVSKILKKGAGTSKKTETEESKYTCEDCGVSLKDGKYKKCYNCNQKNPSPASGGSGKPDYKNGAPYGSLLPEEAERRNRLSVMSASCDAIKVMTGSVADGETLGDMVLALYDKLLAKVKG